MAHTLMCWDLNAKSLSVANLSTTHLAGLARIGDRHVADELDIGRLLHARWAVTVLVIDHAGIAGRVDRVHLEIIARHYCTAHTLLARFRRRRHQLSGEFKFHVPRRTEKYKKLHYRRADSNKWLELSAEEKEATIVTHCGTNTAEHASVFEYRCQSLRFSRRSTDLFTFC